jgi:hypothetical protein
VVKDVNVLTAADFSTTPVCDICPCRPQPNRPIMSPAERQSQNFWHDRKSLFDNILPVSPGGSRFCEDLTQDSFRKALKINILAINGENK